MDPVKITFDPRVEDFDAATYDDNGSAWNKSLPPGTSWWVGSSVLRFMCPCGCGNIGAVPVYTDATGYGWKWDGNKELPTLTPSIQKVDPGGCRWHGYLTAGLFVTC